MPFTDRSYVCTRRGRVFRPMQLQDVLDGPSTSVVVDTTGESVNGYRVVKQTLLRIDELSMKAYTSTCEAIAGTLDAILDRCEELGYNVTRDYLRIALDDDSFDSGGTKRTVVKLVKNTLPVLVLPFSDNSANARYAIPGWDGSACMLRLNDAYESSQLSVMKLHAVNRTVRELKTVEWLRQPSGAWRNGWYEDREGGRWFSDLLATDTTSLGILMRGFDMVRNTEVDCVETDRCGKVFVDASWGSSLHTTLIISRYSSVTIMNESFFGVFYFSARTTRHTVSVFDLNVLLSNLSLLVLLVQWAVAKIALVNSYRADASELQAAGIGVLSCAKGFHWLPLFLLPRLKTNLAVFATAGVTFEGSQLALSNSWFVMYPGLAELVFFVFSVLNLLAKLLRRRMTDALFGPTLGVLCAMQFFRSSLALSGWLGYDSRTVTIVSSSEFKRMSLLDTIAGDTLLHLGGNVRTLFLLKVGVLALNALPLVFSQPAAAPRREASKAEVALALHAVSSGGLGLSRAQGAAAPEISSYDLTRLGYVVVDGAWLMRISNWLLFAALTATRLRDATTLRVVVFAVECDAARGCYTVERKPVLCQLRDARIRRCRPWAISAAPLE